MGGLALDANGDLFVSDAGNSRVLEYLLNGSTDTYSTSGIVVAGTGGAGPSTSQLSQPTALAVDGSGDLYVFDNGNGRIVEVTGNPATGAYSTNATIVYQGSLDNWPEEGGLTVDAHGDLFFGNNYSSAVIYEVASAGGPPPPPTIPTVTGVSPNSGPTAGGNFVTVTGAGVANASILFGSQPAAEYSCSATSCIVWAPPGSGTVDVYAATTVGTSQATPADHYTYVSTPPPAPSVSRVSPNAGPPTGGTAVTISGSNLSGGSVTFGFNAATDVTCTASSCTAMSPSGTGAVDVQVSTAGGTSATGSADVFTYQAPPPPAPVVTGISPSTGPATGGTVVTVTGTNLTGATVAFGSAAATKVTCTAGSCTATSPAGSGTVNVIATTAGGSSAAEPFTYQAPPPPAPVVTGISPSTGPATGGTVVTLTGTNLTGAIVAFGSAAATKVTCTAGSCTATSPAGSGTVNVIATTAGGSSAAEPFTYQAPPPPAPVVTGISPSTGPATGGTVVTLTGTNLTGATVAFGSAAATKVTCTAGSCTATSPAGSGTVNVIATTAGGSSAAEPFTYQAASPNLIPDPGFETSAVPSDYWGCTLSRSGAVVHSGSWSLVQTASSTSGGWDLDSDASWYAPVSSTKTYTATIWVYATAKVKVDENLDLLNASGAYINSVNGATVTLVADTWTQLTITGVKPASGEVYGGMEPNFSSAAKGTVLYWDDMSLTAS